MQNAETVLDVLRERVNHGIVAGEPGDLKGFTPGSGEGMLEKDRTAPRQHPYLTRPRPRIGKALTDRQHDQPAQAIAIAWSAQQRLYRTWTRLEQRSKRRTIIAVAAARELAGFAWAITQIE